MPRWHRFSARIDAESFTESGRLPLGIRPGGTGFRHPQLPAAPLPAGSIAAHRRVHPDGGIMVNKQPMKLGPRHAGKLVTAIIEDTCYRILHGEEELAVKPRKDTSPITRLYVRGAKTQT